jgi:RNA 3'-terminal phosphate cyclase (ATP)
MPPPKPSLLPWSGGGRQALRRIERWPGGRLSEPQDQRWHGRGPTAGSRIPPAPGSAGGAAVTADVLEVDGSRFSGSGTIVRQAAGYSALTGMPVRVVNARANRPSAGLRPQHVAAVRAVRDLVGGELEGATVGAGEFVFHPGASRPEGSFRWEVGSAGSTTALALAILPVLALNGRGVDVELRGGVFQDFAPSLFHLGQIMRPLLERMGVDMGLELIRPGYVPKGDGIIRLTVPPADDPLRPLVLLECGAPEHVWGIALASHLKDRRVAGRMADEARRTLAEAGMSAVIEERDDETAAQPGAALSLFVERRGGCRLGADRAGAPRRSSESIGRRAARQLLEEIGGGGTVDRFTADQLITFAAMAGGRNAFRASRVTAHVHTSAWLASLFLGVAVEVAESGIVSVSGRREAGRTSWR